MQRFIFVCLRRAASAGGPQTAPPDSQDLQAQLPPKCSPASRVAASCSLVPPGVSYWLGGAFCAKLRGTGRSAKSRRVIRATLLRRPGARSRGIQGGEQAVRKTVSMVERNYNNIFVDNIYKNSLFISAPRRKLRKADAVCRKPRSPFQPSGPPADPSVLPPRRAKKSADAG